MLSGLTMHKLYVTLVLLMLLNERLGNLLKPHGNKFLEEVFTNRVFLPMHQGNRTFLMILDKKLFYDAPYYTATSRESGFEFCRLATFMNRPVIGRYIAFLDRFKDLTCMGICLKGCFLL